MLCYSDEDFFKKIKTPIVFVRDHHFWVIVFAVKGHSTKFSPTTNIHNK